MYNVCVCVYIYIYYIWAQGEVRKPKCQRKED